MTKRSTKPAVEEEVVAEAPVVEETLAEAPAEKPKKADKKSTVFVFKNGESRTFSESVHGEDWESLADEFEATNKATIASRDGK